MVKGSSGFNQVRSSRRYVHSFGRNSRNTWHELPDKIHKKLREMVEERDGLICCARYGDGCGNQFKSADLTVDHIIPIRAGGPVTDTGNMQLLCVKCHKHKTFTKDIEYSTSFKAFFRAKALTYKNHKRLEMH